MQQVEVRAASEAYDPRRDDTANKIVVNHEEIVKYGDTSILDVLKRLPGITVSGANGRGGEIRMRGLGSGYTQVLLNGERAPAGVSIDSLAPDAIERIEIIRAASAEFSTQSIAGTINIVLKKVVTKAERSLKAGYGKGPGFASPNLTLLVSDRVDSLSYSVTASLNHNASTRQSSSFETDFDPAGVPTVLRAASTVANGRNDSLNLAPRLNWSLSGGDSLTSQSFVYVGTSARHSSTESVTTLGPPQPYADVANHGDSGGDYLREDLSWTHKLANEGKLELKLGVSRGDGRSHSHDDGYDTGGAHNLAREVDSHSRDQGASSTGKYTVPVVDGHALSAGWDAGYNQRRDARVQAEAALPGATPYNSDESFDATVARLAMYAQDEWNVTKRWSVYLGLRWEGIDTHSTGSGFDPVASRSSVWSPLLQTLWKLPDTKGDQLRFALTRTYKAPGTSSLIPRRFTSTNNSADQPDYRGNPNLKPELALGFDASYDHYFAEGALLSASVSSRRIDGYTHNGVILDAGRWVSLPINDGQAHTRGLELEAKFPLKTVFEQAPAIDLRASVSRNWSAVDAVPGPDNRLDRQTPVSANFGLDYKNGALTTGGSFGFRNGGPVRLSVTETNYEMVRRDLDLYALWKFSPSVQLRLAGGNLLRQPYDSQYSYSDASGTLRRRDSYPGYASLRANLEWKF